MRPTEALLLLALSLTTAVSGQTPRTDNSFIKQAKNQAIRLYEQAMYRQTHVYEGHEYIAHDHRIQIHPYYVVDSLQAGTVSYNGVTYQHVRMLYDIVRDELAIQPPEGPYRLRVQNDKIAGFSLGSHQFARIISDSVTGIRTGFYEVLYSGNTKALAQRQKVVHEDISSGSYKADYLPKDRFFILKEGVYYEVKTKRSMLSLFPEQAKDLRKYIRANHLKFNDEQREEAITRLTQRHEELTH